MVVDVVVEVKVSVLEVVLVTVTVVVEVVVKDCVVVVVWVILVLVTVACCGHQQDTQLSCFGKLDESMGYLHKLRTHDSSGSEKLYALHPSEFAQLVSQMLFVTVLPDCKSSAWLPTTSTGQTCLDHCPSTHTPVGSQTRAATVTLSLT